MIRSDDFLHEPENMNYMLIRQLCAPAIGDPQPLAWHLQEFHSARVKKRQIWSSADGCSICKSIKLERLEVPGFFLGSYLKQYCCTVVMAESSWKQFFSKRGGWWLAKARRFLFQLRCCCTSQNLKGDEENFEKEVL